MKEQGIQNKIFRETNCPDASLLLGYSKGELPEDAAWNIEKHITDCPLCSDALEGLALISGAEVLEEVREQNNYTANFDFKKHKSRELKIVLTAGIMAIASLVILYLNKPTSDKPIVPKQEITSTPVNKTLEEPKTAALTQQKIEIAKRPVTKRSGPNLNLTVAAANDSIVAVYNYTAKTDSNLLWTAQAHPVITDDHLKEKNSVLSVSGLPVTYIYELKVIDYTSIYDQLARKKPSLLKSLDPRFQNAERMEAEKENPSLVYDTLVYSKLLNDALLAYREERYANAQYSFKKILTVYPDDQNALFYGGLSYYNLDKPEAAIQQLEKILDHHQSPFKEESMWYMALSYHKNNQNELSKQWLERVIAEKGFYEVKAKDFLKGLK